MNYDPKYVESLEAIAIQMAHALELSQQVIAKTGAVSPEITADKITASLNGFYELNQANSI